MLQAVLEDQFKLKLRRTTREVPLYALTVAPGGSRLKPFEIGSCLPMPITAAPPALPAGQKYCTVIVGIQSPAVHAQGSTLTELSHLLSLILDRPVIDQTGILGKFDVHMKFVASNTDPPKSDTASIQAALQQLGLKLELTNGPREFLVIDHVERPSINR